ncbi:hypothetical protein ACIHEJ_34290 [Streptomyces sp. NPDC052301]|uniref:hypothetical protein n=1 Tax=Streptomyces sp. NPDC052301 TaxID=3365687 RepID=UPI0037D1CDEC
MTELDQAAKDFAAQARSVGFDAEDLLEAVRRALRERDTEGSRSGGRGTPDAKTGGRIAAET